MKHDTGPTSLARHPAGNTLRLAGSIVAGVVVLLCLALAPFWLAKSYQGTPAYKGQPAEIWYYGGRTNFFDPYTRESAQKAIDELGANAFPFLFSILKAQSGSSPLYFKVYGKLPRLLQAKLPYPISGDDMRAVALGHLGNMHSLASEQIRTLADVIPGFRNPRLRMRAFQITLTRYQTDPAFLELCRQLLNDECEGVRLYAAIYLAQSAIQTDPAEARLFSMLMAAMRSKPQRQTSINIMEYAYQRQPPGVPGARRLLPPGFPFPRVDPDESLRVEIMRGLYRLERFLSPAQKEQFRTLAGRGVNSISF